jgi:tetratricopeptide (TPR) repeat protein
VAYLNEKKPERASELFKEAMPFAFDNFLLAKIYYMLGNANFELNNEEEAVKNWKLAKKKGLNSQELIDKLSKYE